LFKEDGYEHREALFGMPPYGGSITQNVFYANSKLCDAKEPQEGFPARDYVDGKMKPWPSPYILMVDRGDCTFVQKVRDIFYVVPRCLLERQIQSSMIDYDLHAYSSFFSCVHIVYSFIQVRNAQHMGASGVIIADDKCLCTDSGCMETNPQAQCETNEPIMADDGSGGDISIPSFLMYKRDADLVKDEVKQNRPVQMEMAWSLPNPDDRVEYDLWTLPTDVVSKPFLQKFKKLAMALGDKAYFTPHMYIHDGVKSHCVGNDGENFCYTLCTNNGRYCATDPDNDLERGISGADVVRESLRRICIWSYYGASDGIGEKWWDYVTEFTDRCSSADYFADNDCIKDAYKHSGIDGDKIERCMTDSGDTTKDVSNGKLEIELATQSQRGVVIVPTAYVNTAVIRGALTPTNVFTAICAGYSDGTIPAICNQCGKCGDAVACVEKGYCPSSSGGSGQGSGGGVSTHTFATSMLMVICIFSALGVWHYKRTREEMRDQVRGILAEYMPLEDQDRMTDGNPMDFARGGGSTSLIS
jgi:hypothetical protein